MRAINTLSEIQKIELNILEYIDSFCNNHNLRFFLAGGTLLGAVRHKGFIPWDDDMDISMPRLDYDKFVKMFDVEAEKLNSPYRIARIRNSERYCIPFIKVVDTRTIMYANFKQKYTGDAMGIFVDIFPIDGVSGIDQIPKILKTRDKCLALGRSFSSFKNLTCSEGIRLFIRKVQFGMRNREQFLEKLEDCFRKSSFDKSPYVMSTFGLRDEKEVILQECFSKSVLMEFEKQKFPVPIGYKQYLTQMYGDYMKLPPESKRTPPHDYTAYWKDGYGE